MKSGEAQVTPQQRYAAQHVDGSPMQLSGQVSWGSCHERTV
jgi:hypothetical protein